MNFNTSSSKKKEEGSRCCKKFDNSSVEDVHHRRRRKLSYLLLSCCFKSGSNPVCTHVPYAVRYARQIRDSNANHWRNERAVQSNHKPAIQISLRFKRRVAVDLAITVSNDLSYLPFRLFRLSS